MSAHSITGDFRNIIQTLLSFVLSLAFHRQKFAHARSITEIMKPLKKMNVCHLTPTGKKLPENNLSKSVHTVPFMSFHLGFLVSSDN